MAVERGSGGSRSKGSASRPNPKRTPRPKVTPTPPSAPPRRSANDNKRPRPKSTPSPQTRPSPKPPMSTEDRRDANAASRNRTAKKPAKKGRPNSPSPRGVDQKATAKGPTGKKPSGPVQRNHPIHPEALPIGLHGGEQLRLGFIKRVPQPGEKHPYAFHFLYNPFSISIATGLNVDVTFDAQDIGPNFASGAQTITFQVLLNRMMDMTQTGASRGGVTLNLRQLQELRRYGTLHDIEYLYRCCNGDPQNLYSNNEKAGATTTFTALTGDIGFLYSSPVEVHFGADLRFAGIINSVGIEHKMFNKGMVPLLSEVSITLTRIAGTGVKIPTTTTTTEAT